MPCATITASAKTCTATTTACQVTVAGEELNPIGLLVDFADMKRVIRAVVARLDHQFLNDLSPFDAINPSAENLARYFYDEISGGLAPGPQIREVKIWETDITSAAYRPIPSNR